MIQLYRLSAKGIQIVKKNHLQELAKNPKGRFWLDLQAAKKEELLTVAKILKLHQLTVKTLLANIRHSRLEEYQTYLTVVVHALQLEPRQQHFSLKELDLILSKNFLITNHREELPAIKELTERIQAGAYNKPTPSTLLYNILDLLIEKYHPHLENFDQQLDHAEDKLFKHSAETSFQQIDALKKEVTRLRRKLTPQQEVFNILSHHKLIPENERLYIRDLYSHLLHVMETLDNFHEMTIDLMNGYHSLMSNKLNEIMKILTIFATITLPLTVITGIYGMNFRYLPEFEWQYGYYFALGLMALIAFSLLAFFRHKKWL